jgi:hypothetical protein
MDDRFPSQPSWKLVTPPPEIVSAMSSTLSRKLLPLAALTTPHGPYGTQFVLTSVRTLTLPQSTTQSLSYKFLCSDTAPVSWLPAGLRFALAQWKEPFVLWAKHSLHWDGKIHVCSPPESSTCVSPDSFQPTRNKTHCQAE